MAASGGRDPANERSRPPADAAEAPTGRQSSAPPPDQPAQVPASSAAPVPYGQPHYHPAQYPVAGPPVVALKTNGFAIASLVLGILWIYWIGSILALVFGMVAKSQIDRSGGFEQGRGMAIAGIVLGWVGIGFLLLFILFFGIAGCGAVLAQ